MDGTKNSLTRVREFPQEPNNIPRALAIQPRCRLVQKQQQLRFRSEFNADGKTLSSLDIEREDNRICQRLKLQQLNNLLDIRILLLLRDVVRLPQVSGEPHRLTDSRRPHMHIHLLRVGGSPSEVAPKRPSIHKQITSDDTDILPLRENVETRGLPGTRSTHKGRQRTRLDISINVVKESKTPTRDGHGIINTFPGESLAISEGVGPLKPPRLLLFDGPGDLLLLPEGRVKFGSLLRLLGKHGEGHPIERRSLERPLPLDTLTK